MSPATAHLIWIAGEAFVLFAGCFAIWSIQRDVRRAWPDIVRTLKGPTDDDA